MTFINFFNYSQFFPLSFYFFQFFPIFPIFIYFSQFFQGDQNLDADPIDVGEHNGDISWQFMIHNKTISMEDIRGIDCESEDMSELVDNVYAFYEGYLPSNKEVQIKSENRVVVEVSFRNIDDEIYDWYVYE